MWMTTGATTAATSDVTTGNTAVGTRGRYDSPARAD